VLAAAAAQLLVDMCDLALEMVDQLEARVDAATLWLRHLQAIEQLTAGYPEQVAHRARMPEGDHRRVNAVLEARLVVDQVHPKTSLLAL
jgi:hypothetical protein